MNAEVFYFACLLCFSIFFCRIRKQGIVGEAGKEKGNAKREIWVNEMAQWVKVVVTICDNLILIPGTHMIGENQHLQVVL